MVRFDQYAAAAVPERLFAQVSAEITLRHRRRVEQYRAPTMPLGQPGRKITAQRAADQRDLGCASNHRFDQAYSLGRRNRQLRALPFICAPQFGDALGEQTCLERLRRRTKAVQVDDQALPRCESGEAWGTPEACDKASSSF